VGAGACVGIPCRAGLRLSRLRGNAAACALFLAHGGTSSAHALVAVRERLDGLEKRGGGVRKAINHGWGRVAAVGALRRRTADLPWGVWTADLRASMAGKRAIGRLFWHCLLGCFVVVVASGRCCQLRVIGCPWPHKRRTRYDWHCGALKWLGTTGQQAQERDRAGSV
jgi:hypothetical protein